MMSEPSQKTGIETPASATTRVSVSIQLLCRTAASNPKPPQMTSELKNAFQIGFLIFVPFLVIDMVVANILLSMGMSSDFPTAIALALALRQELHTQLLLVGFQERVRHRLRTCIRLLGRRRFRTRRRSARFARGRRGSDGDFLSLSFSLSFFFLLCVYCVDQLWSIALTSLVYCVDQLWSIALTSLVRFVVRRWSAR